MNGTGNHQAVISLNYEVEPNLFSLCEVIIPACAQLFIEEAKGWILSSFCRWNKEEKQPHPIQSISLQPWIIRLLGPMTLLAGEGEGVSGTGVEYRNMFRESSYFHKQRDDMKDWGGNVYYCEAIFHYKV